MQNVHTRFRTLGLFLLLSCLGVSSVFSADAEGGTEEIKSTERRKDREEKLAKKRKKLAGKKPKIRNDSDHRAAGIDLAKQLNNQKRRKEEIKEIGKNVKESLPNIINEAFDRFETECLTRFEEDENKNPILCDRTEYLNDIFEILRINGTDGFEMLNEEMHIAHCQIEDTKKEIEAYPFYINELVEDFHQKYADVQHYLSEEERRYQAPLLGELNNLFEDSKLFVPISPSKIEDHMSKVDVLDTDKKVLEYVLSSGLFNVESHLDDQNIRRILVRVQTDLDNKIADGKLKKIESTLTVDVLKEVKALSKSEKDKAGKIIYPYYDKVEKLFDNEVKEMKEDLNWIAMENPNLAEQIKAGIAEANKPENEIYESLIALRNTVEKQIGVAEMLDASNDVDNQDNESDNSKDAQQGDDEQDENLDNSSFGFGGDDQNETNQDN